MKSKGDASSGRDAFGIVSFVMGILSILGAIIIPVAGIVFALIGIVFYFVQRRRGITKITKAGLILNIIGLVLSIAIAVAAAVIISRNPELLAQLQGLQGVQ